MTAAALPWVAVTGNGSFGETAARRDFAYADNPSSQVAMLLDGEVIDGHVVRSFSLAWERHPREVLDPLLGEATPPVAIIALGVFSGRSTVTVERLAGNVQDFQFPDNGYRPAGIPVFPGAPAAYFSTLPIKAIASGIRDSGIPALVSNTASTHGCNAVMYTALHLIAERGLDTLAGFIHLPDPPEHVASLGSNGPSMSIELQVAAVRSALTSTLKHGASDIQLPVNEWEW